MVSTTSVLISSSIWELWAPRTAKEHDVVCVLCAANFMKHGGTHSTTGSRSVRLLQDMHLSEIDDVE